MKGSDMGFFELVVQSGITLHGEGEPSEYVSEHTGYLRYHRERDDRVVRVGKLHAYRIHADRAANDGISIFEVCDAHSSELLDLYTTLFDLEEDFYEEDIQQQFTVVQADCLMIDWVVLHPKWRGLKLGLVAIRKAVDLLGGGCGLTVCQPAPVHPESFDMIGIPGTWLPENLTREERQEATRKLRRYLKRMGFRRIGRSPYYGLSMTHVMPSVDDLLKPAS